MDTADRSSRLAAYDRRIQPLIVVGAVAPFIAAMVVDGTHENLFLIVDFASWGIFLVDFVVRNVFDRRFWRSGAGIFDGAIVLLTFPWYIIPSADTAAFMSVFRLARLLRLFTSTKAGSRAMQFASRLGRLGVSLAVVSLFSALVVLNAEPPESGFEHFGDALWWTIVSFTTVGYGDLYPVTPLGRFAGVLMMLAGLAALGTVSAVLADVFRGEADETEEAAIAAILAEVRELRDEVAALKVGDATGSGDP